MTKRRRHLFVLVLFLASVSLVAFQTNLAGFKSTQLDSNNSTWKYFNFTYDTEQMVSGVFDYLNSNQSTSSVNINKTRLITNQSRASDHRKEDSQNSTEVFSKFTNETIEDQGINSSSQNNTNETVTQNNIKSEAQQVKIESILKNLILTNNFKGLKSIKEEIQNFQNENQTKLPQSDQNETLNLISNTFSLNASEFNNSTSQSNNYQSSSDVTHNNTFESLLEQDSVLAITEILKYIKTSLLFLEANLNRGLSSNLTRLIQNFSDDAQSQLSAISDALGPALNVPVDDNITSASNSTSTTSSTTTSTSTTPTTTTKKPSQLVFDDPSKYQGPIVEGWPTERNRSLTLYIRPDDDSTFLLRPSFEKFRFCQIVLLVHTTPEAFESRTVIRNTWGSYNNSSLNTTLVFMFGLMSGDPKSEKNVELAKNVSIESSKFGDIVQIDLIEHYNNLTLKTMHMLKYFFDCSNFRILSNQSDCPRFLFKVDEDSFVYVPQLSSYLLTSREVTSDYFIMGCVYSQTAMRQRHVIPQKQMKLNFTDKWITPTYMFNGAIYPEFISGSGYVMSRSATECLYREGMRLPFLHLEDVFLSGFVAEICQIPRIHHKGFHPHKDFKKILQSDIHFHYVDNNDKIKLFERFAALG